MNTISGLPGHMRRAIAAACAVLAALVFISPVAPAAATTGNPSVATSSAPSLTYDGVPVVGRYFSVTTQVDRTKIYEVFRTEWVVDGQFTGNSGPYFIPQDSHFGKRLSARLILKEQGADQVTYTFGESEPVQGSINTSVWHPSAEAILGKSISIEVAPVTTKPALPTAPVPVFVWSRNGVPIPGADASSYTPVEEDMGAEITSTVTISAPEYRTVKVPHPYGTAFRGYLVSSPAITWAGGDATSAPVGTVLSATTPPPAGGTPPGLTYQYQWFDSYRGFLHGETGQTFTTTERNIGNRITVQIVPSAPEYKSTYHRSSDSAAPLIKGVFAGLTAPTIQGVIVDGKIVTAVPATTAPAADLIEYQWYRGTERLTSWDTSPTYLLARDDAGKKITVHARYSKKNYYTATAVSAPVTPPAYFNYMFPPVIHGTAAVGYTVKAETWTDVVTPKPSKTTYQWLRDGKPITGATGLSYRLTATDLWRQITFREIHSRTGYHNLVQTSAAIKPAALFTRLANPVVTGRTAVGYTLKATVATPYPTPTTTTWQWLRNGKPISGATSSSYKLTRYDRDSFIRVKVVFRKTGYLGTARYSDQRWLP